MSNIKAPRSFDSFFDDVPEEEQPNKPAGRTFDSFFDEAPVKVASSTRSKGRDFDSFFDDVPEAGTTTATQNVYSRTVGRAVNKAADWLSGVTSGARNAGFDPDQLYEPARKARAQQMSIDPLEGLATKSAAVGAGLAGVGDVFINTLAGPAQFYRAPRDRFVSRMKEGVQALPGIRELRSKAPEFFDQYADIAQNVMPLPGRTGELIGGATGKALSSTAGRRMLDAAITQGFIGGAQVINDQMKAGKEIDPRNVALGAGVGAIAGGGLQGVEEVVGRLLPRNSQIAEQGAETSPIDMDARLRSLADSGLVDTSDPEFADGNIFSMADSRAEREELERRQFAQQIEEMRRYQAEQQALEAANAPAPMVVNPHNYAPPGRRIPQPVESVTAPSRLTPQQEQVAAMRQIIRNQRAASPMDLQAPASPQRQARQITLEEFRARRQVENASTTPLQFQRPQQDYLDLSPLPEQPTVRTTADTRLHGAIEEIRAASPDNILEAIASAKRAIPRGTPVAIRKAHEKVIDRLAEEVFERHSTIPSLEPAPATLPKAGERQLPKYLDRDAEMAHSELEEKLFPDSNVMYNLPGYGSGGIGGFDPAKTILPNSLSNAELMQALNTAKYESVASKNSAFVKGKWRKIENGLTQEISKRQVRMQKGLSSVDNPHTQIEKLSDDEIYDLIDRGTDKQQLDAGNELLRRNAELQTELERLKASGEIDDYRANEERTAEMPSTGAFRDMKVTREDGSHAYGHDVVEYADASTIEDPQLRNVVTEVATAKIDATEAAHAYNRYSEPLYELFGGDGQSSVYIKGEEGKPAFEIMPPSASRELNTAGSSRQDELRNELSDGTKVIASGRFESVVDRPADDYATVPPLPKTADEAYYMLGLLQKRKTTTEKIYDAARAKLEGVADETLSHAVNIDVNGHNIPVKVHYSREKVGRTFMAEEFAKAKKLDANLTEDHFFGDAYKQEAARLGTSVGSIHDFIARLQRNADGFRNAVDALKNDPQFSKLVEKPAHASGLRGTASTTVANAAAKRGYKLPSLATTARGTAMLGGFALLSDAAANASDGSEEGARRSQIEMNAAALLIASGLTGGAVSRLLKTKAGRSITVFADSLDHVQRIDDILKLQGKNRLDRTILDATAAAAQLGWGVHFGSQNEKARAMSELIDGTVPLATALHAPKTGSALATMNMQQRQAVVGYYLMRKTLGKKVAKYAAAVKAHAERNPQFAQEVGDGALDSLNNLALDMAGAKPRPSGFEKALAHGTSSTMDFYFMMNPKHHLLNLSDSIISGSARLGPGNMARAYKDMLDPEIRKMMNDANLFGSFKEDRNVIGALGGNKTGKMGQAVEDVFRSDEFNANRVALAGFNQFYDLRKDALRGIGYGDYKQFTKDLLTNKGNIPQNIRDDAWAHMLEAQMRILGVDPLRANQNWIKRSCGPVGTVLSFANQPVRMARLLHEFARRGQYSKIATFALATTILGGEAVIPASLQYLGDQMAPEEMSLIKKAANSLSIPGAVANAVPAAGDFVPSLSSKLQYDPTVPFLFGSTSVGFEGAKKLVTKGMAALKASASGDGAKMSKAAYDLAKAGGAQLASGLPVGELLRLAEAGNKAIKGEGRIYNFPSFSIDTDPRPLSPAYDLEYDTRASGRAYPILESILPGEMENTYRYKRASAERQKTKGPDARYAFAAPFGR